MAEPGRPTSYKPEYDEQAYNYALLGVTDKQLAEFFEVSLATIHNWKKDHPSFLDSLKAGKEQADSNVGKSLYSRAMGYSHSEEKIFISDGEIIRAETTKQYPPDTTAAIFWLKNRQPDKWRDRQEHTGAGGKPLIPELTDEEAARRTLFAMTRLLKKQQEDPDANDEER